MTVDAVNACTGTHINWNAVLAGFTLVTLIVTIIITVSDRKRADRLLKEDGKQRESVSSGQKPKRSKSASMSSYRANLKTTGAMDHLVYGLPSRIGADGT